MTQNPIVPIVGVGASAGGVEALEGFFRGLPKDPGVGVVVITHLAPNRRSHLHEIIARYTNLEVQVAEHGVKVGINCVYVLPANALLGIEGGTLQIRESSSSIQRERKPIDIFLSALAKDIGEHSAAIILSGGDGDGTLGVKAVKERGGLTIAQVANGDGPAHPDMPDSAISTGYVDFAIPAHEMGARLAEFARGLQLLDKMADGAEGAETILGEDDRSEIYALLRKQTMHDFEGYKTKTFIRRVQRRMQIVRIGKFQHYVERLREDAEEVNALFRDLLIGVTNFFRDNNAFDKLAELVIPKLFESRSKDDIVRIWVPGCATGEEVYSIAILVREYLDTIEEKPLVQIFATDIDEHALAVARAARYPEALMESVSPERKKRFFSQEGGSYVLRKGIRDYCIFSPHSVIRDPPFSRIDLVSCRNLLIYFGHDVQNQVIPTFHYALRPGGFLFLGTSENVSQFGELFSPMDKKHRIFRATEDHMGVARLPLVLGQAHGKYERETSVPSLSTRGIAFRQLIEAQVMDRFAPAHVVANRDAEIVYYSSRTGSYLEAAPGVPTRQLFNLVRKGLRLDVRAAFRESVERGRRARRDHVEIERADGPTQSVSIIVEPLSDHNHDEPLFVVLFNDEGTSLRPDAAANFKDTQEGPVSQLEAELRETRERLQSVVEEYETALEELKSSNEELLSVNEELQSTNEELEASKEELQSLNEELHTVNVELSGKIDALAASNSDLENLFENTQVAMVFLAEDLTIRTFTPAMAHIFNILPSDRGRPLTDLTSRFELPGLQADVRNAAANGKVFERTLDNQTDRSHYLMRIAPYRNLDNTIEGAVVTFIDVTSLTESESHQKTLISELNHRVKNMLGVVIGLAGQMSREASSLEEFRDAFVSRLHAMARSYELLSRENWKDAALVDLIEKELAPFDLQRISIDGPPARLKPRQAMSVGMIVHELATNAAKYGALSAPDGAISIVWGISGQQIRLRWKESGGPSPARSRTNGFGLHLVEREASYNLGGSVDLVFRRTGLDAKVTFDRDHQDTTDG